MLGRFDEVYLLDWGLAISTEPSDRLPTLHTSYGIAGSPAYMAPEQFEPVPVRVGAHTDVFLLGACLYELITEKPPNAGKSLHEIRQLIQDRVEPPLPDDTPPELATIVRRAMALDIDTRFASVQQMREEMEAFLQHRGSQDLARRAAARVSVMRELQLQRDDDGAERAFVEATFGYRMALEGWQGNEQARDELDALVRERVAQLLALHASHSARRALAVLDDPDPELARRVERAIEKEASERKTLRRLVRDEDRRVGYRVRRLFVVFLGGAWVVFWIVMGLRPPSSTTWLIAGTLALLIPSVGATLYFKQEMLEVRLYRYIALIVCVMFLTQLLWLIGAGALGVPMRSVLTTLFLIWFMAVAYAVPTIELRILPTAISYMTAFVVCSFVPTLLPWALGVTGVVLLINTMAINLALARRASREPVSTQS
jgi:hypothetical protein